MLRVYNENKKNINKKSQDYFDKERDSTPITNEHVIQIIKKHYIELLEFSSYFGFLKENIIFIKKSINNCSYLTILDLNSNKILYQDTIDVHICFLCLLSENLIFLISNSAKLIFLLDYKQKTITKKTFPENFDFFCFNKIDENKVIMANSEMIYVYTVNSHSFSYFNYRNIIKRGYTELAGLNLYIINKEIILIWNPIKCVNTINIETQSLVVKHIFNSEERFAFVDMRNGIIYNEKDLPYIDKTFIKILVFNFDFRHLELFNYSCFDVLKRVSEPNSSFHIFSIPNSSCLCYTNFMTVEFYDYILNEKKGYFPTLIYPKRIEVSSKYILTEFGAYKIYRNRL